uniref:Uncharacterized protein n=1 Tax=Rhodnius prolixus TaxID=13249 RepID=T1HPS0_RHOPR
MPLSGISPAIIAADQVDEKEKRQAVKMKKRKTDASPFEITVSTANNFEPLSDMESMDEDSIPQPSVSNKTPMAKNIVKIPPIVVYSYIKNHSETLKNLRAVCKQEFDVKCRGNRLIFLTKCKEDYNKILSEVASAKLEYHTYTPKDEINHTWELATQYNVRGNNPGFS